MSGLKLGDLILDARRTVYIPSLKAVVCAGLNEALSVTRANGLRGILERIDGALNEYRPDYLIGVGNFSEGSALRGVSRRWGKKAKIHLVSFDAEPDAWSLAESLGCEVHRELIWGHYRFIDRPEKHAPELQLFTLTSDPHYAIRIGKSPFGGMRLAAFLKGPGKLYLPALNPSATGNSVFESGLERFDVFAVGHQRVLPLGKVLSLKPFKGIAKSIPLSKSALAAGREPHPEKPKDKYPV